MVLELRPAHNPREIWGLVGLVTSVADLTASVWLWYRDDDRWAAKKVIAIPAEPAEASQLAVELSLFGSLTLPRTIAFALARIALVVSPCALSLPALPLG